jgi:N6-adenosine-specific RNA methylase IME4/ParB-like chromosome segregation protein Spo0J
MIIDGKETHKFADIFPMIEVEELDQLKADIKEHGLLQPIILYEDKILDGRNRLKACNEMGVEPKFETYRGNKPLEYVISENLKRRHLSASQRAVIGYDVLPLLEEEARKRMISGKNQYNSPVVLIPQPIKKQQEKENKSAFQAGKIVNVGEKYMREVKKLKEAHKEKEIEQIRSGEKTITEIKKEQRKEKIQEQREAIISGKVEMPKGTYEVIVIDPPWNYEREYDPENSRVASPYPEMTQEELKQIKLPSSKDCVLWIWSTHKFIWDAKELLEKWGFEYKAVLVWDKQKLGMGSWLRMQCEFCLLGIKGKPIWNLSNERDLISEARTNHSKKPDLFYSMIDKLCAGRKLDYFARKKRDGWDVFGDEVK